jgi:rod shape-determining protein MreC
MKRIIFFLIIIFVALIFLMIFSGSFRQSTKDVTYSITDGSSHVLSGFGQSLRRKFSFIFHIIDLKKQNNELTDKLLELQVDKSRINELEIENQLLKTEFGFFDQSVKGSLVPARIIVREPTSFFDYFVIDKGSDDGIVEGAPVIFNGVLVGQIKEVYSKNSKVVLVTSKDSLVQVMLQDCRAKGILKGGIGGLFVDNIVTDTDYKIGEYIITSGLGGKMRAGILIGKAGQTQSSSSGIFKSVEVTPIIDISTLEIVFVEKS